MHLESVCVRNYRRLRDVRIEIDPETSIFVGANNSGKTSAAQVLEAFLGSTRKDRFAVHDFSAECWNAFDTIGADADADADADAPLPAITLDLWFKVAPEDLHRVIRLLPSLEWQDAPVGVRLEFAPRNQAELLANYRQAHAKAAEHATRGEAAYHPWPKSLHAYLERKLGDEYKIHYYVLDPQQFDADHRQLPDYTPMELGDASEAGATIIKNLIRVDVIGAQRHLSDEPKAQAENLSRRLSRFYERNLAKYGDDFRAVAALARSEKELNEHLELVFGGTLASLNELGYPGFADPNLVIRSAFDPESILSRSTAVHYTLRDPGDATLRENAKTLPDKYNGLGFKNLIYMIIEILDQHQRWAGEEEPRPPVHLLLIEEPEAHLHAQLQQVFIKKIRKILPEADLTTQIIVTTHSPHIIYESNFKPIRYFRRMTDGHYSTVLSLSRFYEDEAASRDFLLRYMRLTHCDLFFADAAVLVEGSVERLLLPLMIDRVAPELQSKYLCILEVGGAFAHRFRSLIHFLGLHTLVITDLDSVVPAAVPQPLDDAEEGDGYEDNAGEACMADGTGAVTSNQSLRQWLPGLATIAELLAASDAQKCPLPTATEPASVRVAYQTEVTVAWADGQRRIAGRTFEEAFAFENLDWCQQEAQKPLGLKVVGRPAQTVDEITTKLHKRIRASGFRKTDFALALMMAEGPWQVPTYIAHGLRWLNGRVEAVVAEPEGVEGPGVEAA